MDVWEIFALILMTLKKSRVKDEQVEIFYPSQVKIFKSSKKSQVENFKCNQISASLIHMSAFENLFSFLYLTEIIETKGNDYRQKEGSQTTRIRERKRREKLLETHKNRNSMRCKNRFFVFTSLFLFFC